jgi:DNA-binding transcriptional LysR family regulator
MAARELHFTQSALSQQIATLERDLGAALVHRSPVGLTDAGAALCRRYKSVLAELAAARAELDMFRDGGCGRVRIAASAGSIGRLVTRAIATVTSSTGNH